MRACILAPILFLATAGAAQAPGLSDSDRATGARANPQLTAEFGGAYTGPQAAYVRAVGQRIAAQSGLAARAGDYTVTLLNSNANNAFAIPGGYVYVTRQLVALMNDEAELAFVMGHEVGHVAARHSQKRQQTSGLASVLAGLAGAVTGSSIVGQLAGTGAQMYTLGYSRDQERQADTLGVRYLAGAGYDPAAGADILAALGAQTALEARLAGKSPSERVGWTSTHPATGERVQRVRREAAAMAARSPARAVNRDTFLDAIDGMIYDDDPSQGIVRGSSFRHPALGIAFDAPAGFALQNSMAQVIGSRAGAGQFSFAGGRGGDLAAHSDKVWQNAGAAPQPVRNLRINGLDAAISQTRATTRSGSVDATLVAYRWAPDRIYHLLMIAPAGGGSVFEPLIGSVRRLAPGEAGDIRPRRIAVVTVGAGDTVQSLSRRMAYDDDELARFTVLNGLAADSRLTPGTRVKLVVQ